VKIKNYKPLHQSLPVGKHGRRVKQLKNIINNIANTAINRGVNDEEKTFSTVSTVYHQSFIITVNNFFQIYLCEQIFIHSSKVMGSILFP